MATLPSDPFGRGNVAIIIYPESVISVMMIVC